MLTSRRVDGQLRRFVASIWDYRVTVASEGRDRLLPNGQLGLILNLQSDRITVEDEHGRHDYPGAIVAGPYSRPFFIETSQLGQTMGLTFRPGTAAAFLGLPAGALRNADLGLAELWRSGAEELRERLSQSKGPDERLSTLEQVLIGRLNRARQPDRVVAPALRYLEMTPERVSVGGLAKHFGITERRLAQIFETHVGLSPKSYHRLQRFYRVLRQIHGLRQVDWTTVAHEAGYYDQSHFNHHFREYTGLSPTEYLASQGPYLHHVPSA